MSHSSLIGQRRLLMVSKEPCSISKYIDYIYKPYHKIMDYTKEELQRSCQENAFHLYGTYYIYGQKASKLSRYVYAITLLGFLVPVIIGGVVMAYGVSSVISTWSLAIIIPVSIIQLI